MANFYQYIYNEVKNRRLGKTDAIDLIRQFQIRIGLTKFGFLHPLLHQNTSDLTTQRFSSSFTGKEFFFEDDTIKGRRVLPGIICLEMARAAVETVTGAGFAGILADNIHGIRLKNVVWGRPVMVDDQPIPVNIHIRLFPEESAFCQDDEIVYEIYSSPPGSDASGAVDGEPVVHCQGTVMLNSITEISPLDLNALKAQCSQNTLSYGPEDQGIEKIYLGSDQVLAKLSLPASVLDTKDQYVLHPCILKAALQASLVLTMGPDALETGFAYRVGRT